METLTVSPSHPLKGDITVPGDKSITHRAIILASLSNGKSEIRNVLGAEDCLHTADAMRHMGAGIQHSLIHKHMTVQGVGMHGLLPPPAVVDCGNSGTGFRLLLGLLAGQTFSATLTGDASLQSRPMNRVILPLRMMGAKFFGLESEDKNGLPNTFPPVMVQGCRPLKSITYELPMASAQVKSAILLAGLFSEGVTMVVEPLPSRDHTERMFQGLGLPLRIEQRPEGRVLQLVPGEIQAMDFDVPGDISSAAFWMVAASIVPGSHVLIKNVGVNPTRTGILDVLWAMGADMRLESQRQVCGEPVADIRVRSRKLRGASIGGVLIPRLIDEIPILAVAAACAEGQSIVRDAQELRVKESDRIKTVVAEFSKMGVGIRETDDGMVIEGASHAIRGATVQSYGDHRIAMACAILGLVAKGPTLIQDTDCIATSYPGFEHNLRQFQSKEVSE